MQPIAIRWSPLHEELLKVVIGDPAHQATFEAYTALVALRHWTSAQTRGRVTLVGDAQGILIDMITLKAKSSKINAIAQEVALHLAPLGLSLEGIHIWGETNVNPDALSRLAEGYTIPDELRDVRRIAPSERWEHLEGAVRAAQVE